MIQVIDLYKNYDNGLVNALNGITFNVDIGEACSIMGPSGCGKTTLLNIIGALDVPTSGEIIISEINLKNISPLANYRNQQIGFIFQFHNLIPNLTLVENVELPTYTLPKISNKQRRELSLNMLENVGLSHKANYLPTKVSGGERQLTAVARALINSPKILLADEPTGNVDSNTANHIMSILLRKCKEDNMTTIIVTHNKSIAMMADRIITMRDGKLIS